MRDYTERATDFVKEIYPYIKNAQTSMQFQAAVACFNFDYKRKVRFEYGATRFVLITSDYVIKIDRKNAVEKRKIFGGCHSEYTMYHQAKCDGFDYLFAPITRIVYQHNYFYCMPRVRNIGRPWRPHWTMDEEDYIYDHVFDLHEHNIGYYHGRPIIIDYAAVEP